MTSSAAPLISHIAGDLWMGGCVDRVALAHDFAWVLSLAPRQKFTLGPNTRRAEFDVQDVPRIPDRVEQITNVAVRLLPDGPMLIHCELGFNRSGLIAALVLTRQGMAPADAIALLREKRSPSVLYNTTFRDYVLQSEGIRS